jgi:sulfur carrier protein ThiS
MNVHIPSPLQSYTADVRLVDGSGTTVAELLKNLDTRYPGIRFRMIDEQDAIRRHIRIFINGQLAPSINTPIRNSDDVRIVCALSGG